jgi:hypothetical protein
MKVIAIDELELVDGGFNWSGAINGGYQGAISGGIGGAIATAWGGPGSIGVGFSVGFIGGGVGGFVAGGFDFASFFSTF